VAAVAAGWSATAAQTTRSRGQGGFDGVHIDTQRSNFSNPHLAVSRHAISRFSCRPHPAIGFAPRRPDVPYHAVPFSFACRRAREGVVHKL
jgi:hypothetical protein